jgi:ribosomal protein S18 acetylase RimI-like enzyme
MELRRATLADAAQLAAFGRQAFVAAFGHCYAKADLDPFLEQVYGLEATRADLADPQMRVQLAVDGTGIAGYCLISLAPGWPMHARGKKPVTLHRLYVDPARTGQAIGARLMDWAIAAAREFGADEIQLSVWSENFGGQRFYARHGFEKVADIEFRVTNHLDEEFLFSVAL